MTSDQDWGHKRPDQDILRWNLFQEPHFPCVKVFNLLLTLGMDRGTFWITDVLGCISLTPLPVPSLRILANTMYWSDISAFSFLKKNWNLCSLYICNVYYIDSSMTCCVPSPCSADEEQQRDVIWAAAPPQRAAEERGAGMPRRRRNLAAVMAHGRPQRAVEHGKHFVFMIRMTSCFFFMSKNFCFSWNCLFNHVDCKIPPSLAFS